MKYSLVQNFQKVKLFSEKAFHIKSRCLNFLVTATNQVGEVRDPWNTGTEETFKSLPSW